MKILDKITSPQQLRLMDPALLADLCEEIRKVIIKTVSKTGGHLGSSLGAVDLITALHYVFDTPKDKIVFDTGHQAYAHKILTGRLDKFKTLRKKNGLSGFLKIYESEYDAFGAGHASTALSAALGMAMARDQKKENNKVIAVVADGSMTGGMTYEALQNAGQLKTNLLVILNDNQMFISERVGALGSFLTKLMTKKYMLIAESRAEQFMSKISNNAVKIAKRAARSILFSDALFGEMGFKYYGPVNGNDVNGMVNILKQVKDICGPVILHTVTRKGKGYAPAEKKPAKFHGLGVFDAETGETISSSDRITFTNAFSQALIKLAEKDESITAITAAMPEGTGLNVFREKFPSRYYDVGIAEEHGATFAAGLAAQGIKPVFAVYSSFAQRCYDQIQQDVALQNLPVVFALDRAGVVGEDGPTHHGVFDISLFRSVPGIIIAAPADENELQHMLKTGVYCGKPFILRYPRGGGFGANMDEELKEIPIGKALCLKKGSDANILALGNTVTPSKEAAEMLAEQGIDCGVINMRFAKPLDGAAIKEAASLSRVMFTAEDNMLCGGFGSAVLEYMSDNDLKADLTRLGIKDVFVEHAKQSELYDEVGISAAKIAAAVLKKLKKTGKNNGDKK
ncbi:MAG: 1-deoxy-D-xylulose-5-phosphate synthase [Elusimicrobiota bacterium]|jgi:1-deoxy-D-xylulose-5-phosphate synthase|nr:1-deoxy-D-xylulose-5-phosphate synthase [Elusimicrobiota bacterium]